MIAVHVGAGYHAQTKLPAYKQACVDACRPAVQLLNEGGSAVDAVTLAVSILEDCPITNAGLGSNLTEKGTIELDACVMNSDLKFGACGAVGGVRNPVKLASMILEHQKQPQVLGRVPPCVLVGQGAFDWAKEKGCSTCNPDDLKTPSSVHSYNKYMKHLKAAENSIYRNGSKHSQGEETKRFKMDNGVTDTVGAVCVDLEGNMAAAASSGGILLKHPGRIGPAAMYGCGCWAERRDNVGVAIAASGCGEQLMQTLLVRDCARNVLHTDSVSDSVQDSFTKFVTCEGLGDERNAGLLVLYRDEEADELVWTHSTQTMVLGYASCKSEKPMVEVSKNSGQPGRSSVLGGMRLKC